MKDRPSELEILKHLSNGTRSHTGWRIIRQAVDGFSVAGENGLHPCLVFEPMRESLDVYRTRWAGEVLPASVLKITVQLILHGLDYLHSDRHVIHTGKL